MTNAEYLPKWLLLGIATGVIAGLGAVVFYLALKYTGEFLLGYLAGYHIPTPLVEGGSPGSSAYTKVTIYPAQRLDRETAESERRQAADER